MVEEGMGTADVGFDSKAEYGSLRTNLIGSTPCAPFDRGEGPRSTTGHCEKCAVVNVADVDLQTSAHPNTPIRGPNKDTSMRPPTEYGSPL